MPRKYVSVVRRPMTKESRAAAQRKYNHSAKGKAAYARYAASGKRKPSDKRWQESERGKETARERQRRYRQRHPEKVRESNIRSLRKWREENREAYRIHCRQRRKLEHEAEGFHTIKDIRALFVTQRGLCFCGDELGTTYHVDHMVPLSRGGTDWPENLQLLCPSCNHSKRHRTMEEWTHSKCGTC